jgi:hypothetical protein
MESIAACLKARAMLKTKEGDLEDAWGDLRCCHRLARFLDTATIGLSPGAGRIEDRAVFADAALAHFGKPSPQMAEQMRIDFHAFEPFQPILDKGELGERFIRLDAAVALALEKPKGVGSAIAESVFGPTFDLNLVLKLSNEWFDRKYAAFRMTNKDEAKVALNALRAEIEKIRKEHSLDDLKKQWLPKVVSRRLAPERWGISTDRARKSDVTRAWRNRHGTGGLSC